MFALSILRHDGARFPNLELHMKKLLRLWLIAFALLAVPTAGLVIGGCDDDDGEIEVGD